MARMGTWTPSIFSWTCGPTRKLLADQDCSPLAHADRPWTRAIAEYVREPGARGGVQSGLLAGGDNVRDDALGNHPRGSWTRV
jgi:hypothetical protein